MGWQATPYAIPPLVSAVVSALLMAYVWRYRERPLAKAYLVLSSAIGGWSLVYAIQLASTGLRAQLFWQSLGLAIGGTLPTVWLLFTLVYAGEDDRLTPAVVAVLLLDPVAFALLALTNGTHGLLWSSAAATAGPGLDLAFTPVYFVHITYAYLLVLAGVGVIVGVFVRSSAIYRRQAGLLVFGAVVPLLANVAFTIGVSPLPGLDLTTPAFTLTGVVFALALFRFDFLDLAPVARRRVLDEFGNGVLVADDDGRVVHANGTAREVVPEVTIGAPVIDLLSVETVEAVDGLVTEVEADGRRRFYEFSTSELRDFRGWQVGHVIALQDVTTSREYEQRLEVANRLLRHNLRNDMSKVLGWVDLAREDAGEETLAALDRIETVAEDVSRLSRKARRIESSLEARQYDLETVDAVDVLETVVTDLRTVWPDADLALSAPETAPVRAPDVGLLETAFRNVVENGVEHNDREQPRVEVSVRPSERAAADEVVVSVADDGPGIPAIERDALTSGTETALEHGSGLGLWLVRWIVQTAGGAVDFAENDPRGSVVVLRLPAAEG